MYLFAVLAPDVWSTLTLATCLITAGAERPAQVTVTGSTANTVVCT